MKSGGPWNLRGLRPETREAAREAARRSGMSVGEWLNTVIEPTDEDDPWAADFEREQDEGWRPRRNERDHERYRSPSRPARRRELDDEWRQAPPYDDRDVERYGETNGRRRWRTDDEHSYDRDLPIRRGRDSYRDEPRRPGGPYYEEQRYEEPHRERLRPPRREPEHDVEPAPVRRDEQPAPPPEDRRDAFVDQAVAEITARQRVLDGEGGAESAPPKTADVQSEKPAEQAQPDIDPGAEIRARQRELDEGVAERSFGDKQPQPLPARPREERAPGADRTQSDNAPAPTFDISALEHQLRLITTRIEALRPTGDLEAAINGLRADLAEIGRSLTEALPRRALESLEIEIKALADRIDHSRKSGADAASLAGVERGLADVREALRALTPAENLVGFDEAVQGLAKKVDAIVAKDDPAARQQLEDAVAALRGVVANVASNDTLAKVAEEVRALHGKVDGIANRAPGGPALSIIEDRINVLAAALKASTEAGYAVPRELEKLLSGLIDKIERVQLSHTDQTALSHLEDRIAALVKRLDASDTRLNLLEGIERGLADLLVHIEKLRGVSTVGEVIAAKPVVADAIKQDVERAQVSLEAVQDTVGHVVDRLAMIESDMRVDRARAALTEDALPDALPDTLPAESERAEQPSPFPPPLPELPPLSTVADIPETARELSGAPLQSAVALALPPEPMPPRSVVARAPIDPNLPPDHPLEPGFTSAARARNVPSAAARIAASEAVIESKPPVIPDPAGGKSDFIAAARRAARAAATTAPERTSRAEIAGTQARPKKATDRVRALLVAAAVVVIVVGGFQIVSRFFEDGGAGTPAPAHTQTVPAHPEAPPLKSDSAPAPLEPPRVQSAPPLSPAPAMPSPNAASPPGPPLQLPSADPPPGPDAALPPSWLPGAAPSAGPGTAPPSDITGSLPRVSSPHGPAPISPLVSGDALPMGIGGSVLRTAALAGDPLAAYEVGVRFAEGRFVPVNNEEAARWFDRAAKKGLAPAQFRLATLYEKGVGVKKNLAMARDLYRSAADKGHGKAMHNLAVLYAEGVDGKADYRTASEWFRKAADRGIADSQYNLAILYARGVGVEQNLAESYKWFFLAAKEGDQDAAQKRDEIAARLDEQALAAARIEVESWRPLAQPADAITVKGAWDSPVNEAHATPSKLRSPLKLSPPGAAKTD